MRKFLIVLSATIFLSTCALQQEVKDPAELQKDPIYLEADYLALIENYSMSGKEKYKDVLSGFLINDRDKYYVITAGHIQDSTEKITKILVYFKNHKDQSFQAELVGYDHLYDTAVLAIKDNEFRFTGKLPVLGDSDSTDIGDLVYSLGHPAGSRWYITAGRVTDISRVMTYRTISCKTIEHSAISGFGSSGGPLLNSAGEIIAMNVAIAIYNRKQRASNITRAIPINDIKKRLDALISGYKK